MMKLHHIGVACDDLSATAGYYRLLGYESDGNETVIHDPNQNSDLLFLRSSRDEKAPLIELVRSCTEDGPTDKIFKKVGVSPYHLCFEVECLERNIEELREKGNYIVVKGPVEATAFDGRLIAFLYHTKSGFVELLERE